MTLGWEVEVCLDNREDWRFRFKIELDMFKIGKPPRRKTIIKTKKSSAQISPKVFR